MKTKNTPLDWVRKSILYSLSGIVILNTYWRETCGTTRAVRAYFLNRSVRVLCFIKREVQMGGT